VFAMLVAGAFSTAWNLYASWREQRGSDQNSGLMLPLWMVGLAGSLLIGLLGNLGTIKLIFEGMQRLAAGDAFSNYASIFTKISWTFQGLMLSFMGGGWPFGRDAWYWEPSRVIPAVGEPEPITEFPWFTTIYADLHAHYMALALVFLALAWALAVVFSRAWQNNSRWQVAWSFIFAGLAIGSLRPTNTWDLPTYLALGVVAVLYAVIKYWQPSSNQQEILALWVKKSAAALAGVLALIILTFLLYQPYAHWYGLPYSKINLWRGTHTPIGSYLTHWGVFLFVIIFWMGWETRQWMAATPLSSLRKLEKFRPLIYGVLVILLLLAVAMLFLEVRIHLLALPLAAWAAVLLLRPGLSESKRIVLFMVGTALFLTILVEIIVLSGDIGRMNTVFKFYLQAWVLLAASTAASFGWTLVEVRKWSYGWNAVWRLGLVVLVAGAALFPLTATMAKVQDRMAVEVPLTLDGMAFMRYSKYPDEGGVVQLVQDYDAIRWMQENVRGTPVIVEANTNLYRWGSRFSIYTGLPSVLGWDWHQTQQRGFSQVSQVPLRQQEIKLFYQTNDKMVASLFLKEYQVEYIIVGQLERNYYPGIGLSKFEQFDGDLWQEVYRDLETVIYRVIPPTERMQE
jgi:YYY domain-containing protein